MDHKSSSTDAAAEWCREWIIGEVRGSAWRAGGEDASEVALWGDFERQNT